jgi:hypothetical protein
VQAGRVSKPFKSVHEFVRIANRAAISSAADRESQN